MLFLVLSGLFGAGATLALLWPAGALISCIAAPFGGGITAALAALWLGRQPREARSDDQTIRHPGTKSLNRAELDSKVERP